MAEYEYSPGDRIEWDWTDEYLRDRLARGTVVSTDGPFGRLIVDQDGERLPAHIQPSFVRPERQEGDKTQ